MERLTGHYNSYIGAGSYFQLVHNKTATGNDYMLYVLIS